jgi:hypothetical protein
MKAIKHLAIAATAAVVTMSSANAAWTFNTTSNAGDLIIGIKATGGTGQNTNMFYNLGLATNYLNGGSQGFKANINSDLVAAYGSDWATRTDLYFGVIANRSATNNGGDPDGTGPLEASRILYLSRTTSTPGGSTLYANGTNNANSAVASNYVGLKNGLATLNHANSSVVATLDISGTSTANADAILNSFTAWTTSGAGSDQTFNSVPSAQFLSQLGNNVTNYADIQRIGKSSNGTAPNATTLITTVSFDTLGNISVIPEPSSMLLLGAAGAASLLRRRRQTA